MAFPSEFASFRGPTLNQKEINMGDRSPKSNQKQKSQQAAKTANTNQQKQKNILDQQVAGKKKV